MGSCQLLFPNVLGTCQAVAIKSATSWQQVGCVVVMEFWKRHDTADTTCIATDLSCMLRTCYGLATWKLWGNWCNGFWPLCTSVLHRCVTWIQHYRHQLPSITAADVVN